MLYSEYPHEHYIKNGKGPGAKFLGDLERWNWRYFMFGLKPDDDADTGIVSFFNEHQRAMMQEPPAEALVWLEEVIPERVTEEIRARMLEAQTRLYPPKIKAREGNIITANFGARR